MTTSTDGSTYVESLPDFDDVQPPAKKARVGIPSYSNVDVSQLWLKNNGPNRKGDGIMVLPLCGNVKLVADLTPNTWLRVAFPFNTTGQYEAVSFLGHCAPTDRPEGLNLGIVLDRGQADFLAAVDDKLSKEMASYTRATWHDLLTENDKYHNTTCKVKVMLGKDAETQIKVIGPDQEIHEGRGWDFLSQHVGTHNFRGAKVKVCVRVDTVWNVAKKAGVRLVATHLVLVTPDDQGQVLDGWADDDALLGSLW